MSEQMKLGTIMSHQGLTNICESVSYTIEYFAKENLLKKVSEVIPKGDE